MWWHALLAIAVGLIVVWLLLLALLWRAQRHTADKTNLRDAARLVPDVVRLLRRLAADRTIARSARIRLWLLLAYLISPIDLIPDFIPVLGYAATPSSSRLLSARSPAEPDLKRWNDAGRAPRKDSRRS